MAQIILLGFEGRPDVIVVATALQRAFILERKSHLLVTNPHINDCVVILLEWTGGDGIKGREFPVAVKGLFRPHYITWSEQRTIEAHAPEHLRNIVRIISETGLRIYKELIPMKKEQLDLANAMVWIPDSKTPMVWPKCH